MDIKELLMKRAMGFEVSETTEEYSDVEGELKLLKKKVTKKFIPPDSIALKFLLTQSIDDETNIYDNLSYNELLTLKDELLEQINEITE
mgnify:CR=1 FL=1